MSALTIHGLTKSFGTAQVLRGVDLDVPARSLTAVLGPSGCGKTTLLRIIAGFIAPDSGTVAIGEMLVCDGHRALPPERRGVGYVAQEGALFPHLSVAGNIGYGLVWRDRRSRSRVGDLLELVGLSPSYADRYPHELSGGQQQRVAVARALAPRPPLVLLDEPFSALDAGLRAETRHAIATAFRETDTTAVLVTHDQDEALSIAGRVAVMRSGVLVQVGTPAEVYSHPADLGVARFVGESVVLPGAVHGGVALCALGAVSVSVAWEGAGHVVLRPEQVLLRPGGGSVEAHVEGCTYYGHDALVTVRLLDGSARVTARCAGGTLPLPGARVSLGVTGVALAFPAEPGNAQPLGPGATA